MIRSFTLALALATLTFSLQAQSTDASASGNPLYRGTITPEAVNVQIDAHTTREGLAQMQRDLFEAGVHMRYEGIQWENGLLTSIHVGVKIGEQEGIVEHFTGITEDAVIRIHVAGTCAERKLCLGKDCPAQ